MTAYLLRRFGQMLLTLFMIISLAFFLVQAQPGDYTSTYAQNPNLPPDVRAKIQASFGLDKSLGEQYLLHIKNSFTGNFGVSFGHYPRTVMDVIKETRKLRKRLTRLSQIDFFPGAVRDRVDRALQELETDANRVLSPDEPLPASGIIHVLDPADYQSRLWATRRRPWVDRLASAWLIKQFIDPQAHFVWLNSPDDCPNNALGFDFDGATFTHVAEKVTFETLLASFDLRHVALQRIGELVHYLDVGGYQPPEASGVEYILMGLRETLNDDDQLLLAANQVFDSLYTAYNKGE